MDSEGNAMRRFWLDGLGFAKRSAPTLLTERLMVQTSS